MTATGSTWVATRTRIVTLLEAHADIVALKAQVYYDTPVDEPKGRLAIYCTRTENQHQRDIRMLAGTRRRQAMYTHHFTCEVVQPGKSQFQVDTTCEQLHAAIDDIIANNPIINGASISAKQQIEQAVIVAWTTEEGPWEHAGHGRRISVAIQITERFI